MRKSQVMSLNSGYQGMNEDADRGFGRDVGR